MKKRTLILISVAAVIIILTVIVGIQVQRNAAESARREIRLNLIRDHLYYPAVVDEYGENTTFYGSSFGAVLYKAVDENSTEMEVRFCESAEWVTGTTVDKEVLSYQREDDILWRAIYRYNVLSEVIRMPRSDEKDTDKVIFYRTAEECAELQKRMMSGELTANEWKHIFATAEGELFFD